MPNYKLGRSSVKERIVTTASEVAHRPLGMMLGQCPLTRDDIEQMYNDPGELRIAREAIACGYAVAQQQCVFMGFNPDNLPGVSRGAVIGFTFDRSIIAKQVEAYGRSPLSSKSYDYLKEDARYHKHFDMDRLDPEKRQRLVEWLVKVVRLGRLHKMVESTTREVLRYCETTGHVLAWWPSLATLADGDDLWRGRFRNTPRKLEDYAPVSGLATMFASRISACETLLVQGMMLPAKSDCDKKSRDGITHVSLSTWQVFDKDPGYTR